MAGQKIVVCGGFARPKMLLLWLTVWEDQKEDLVFAFLAVLRVILEFHLVEIGMKFYILLFRCINAYTQRDLTSYIPSIFAFDIFLPNFGKTPNFL
jgi:hypothetical protein